MTQQLLLKKSEASLSSSGDPRLVLSYRRQTRDGSGRGELEVIRQPHSDPMTPAKRQGMGRVKYE
jgi:hypothetical protein